MGVGLVRLLAPGLGWMSAPRGDRWHARPTALMGGVGFLPFVLAAGALAYYEFARREIGEMEVVLNLPRAAVVGASLLGGALLLLVVGWIDDRRELRPRTKLMAQLFAASQLIYFGGGTNLTGWPILDVTLSYLWIIGLTNSINLLDNMDGLCAGTAALMAAALAYALPAGPAQILAAVICGGCLGFLWHNRPPAKIFMGDTGSLPLGFLLAGLALPGVLNGGWGAAMDGFGPKLAAFLSACILMAVPILDTGLVACTRVWAARSPMDGGKDHSSHRLARILSSERRALLFLLLLTAGACLVFLWSLDRRPFTVLSVLGLAAGVLWLAAAFLARTDSGRPKKAGEQPPSLLCGIRDFFQAYNLLPVLLDGLLVLLLFQTAYLLRFDFNVGPDEIRVLKRSLPIVLLCCLAAGLGFGIYSSRWGSLSWYDLCRLGAATGAGTAASLALVTLVGRFGDGHSRSVYLIFALLFLTGQIFTRKFLDLGGLLAGWAARDGGEKTPVAIFGAGRRGRILAEACLQVPELLGYRALAFIDQNESLAGKRLCGLPILTPRSGKHTVRLPAVPEEIWISAAGISPAKIRPLLPVEWRRTKIRRLILGLTPAPGPRRKK